MRRQTQEQLAVQARSMQAVANGGQSSADGTALPNMPMPQPTVDNQGAADGSPKQDHEYVDEVVAILKTAFPLLVLTLETMVDQFNVKFKPTPEEEIYRFTFMLLQDGIQVCRFYSQLMSHSVSPRAHYPRTTVTA